MTAVIYARYSSDSQREASIEGQLRDCKDYAEKNGITVVGTYIDRALVVGKVRNWKSTTGYPIFPNRTTIPI